MAATHHLRHLARHAAALLVALAVLPAPHALAAGAASGVVPEPARVPAAEAARPYRLNLADDEDFVRQRTFVQCVGASIQMMLNISRPGADRSARTQRRLQVQARSLSGPRPDGTERRGAGVFGWADALNHAGEGSYAVVGADTLGGAMRIAARAIREEQRPVGLLVWGGRHAWVMSGFESTGDPRDGAFRVTAAYILDPLHPFGSRSWGPSPRPGSAIGISEVGRQFVRRRVHSEWNRLPGMAELAGRYVLVVPVDGPPPVNPAVPASADPAALPTGRPVVPGTGGAPLGAIGQMARTAALGHRFIRGPLLRYPDPGDRWRPSSRSASPDRSCHA